MYRSPEDDCRAVLLAQLAGACKSLHLNIFEFNDPDVADALIAQHAAGLTVAVVADHRQSAPSRKAVTAPTKFTAPSIAQRALLQRLLDAGIEVTISAAPSGEIDHEKVVLIDMVDGVLADTSRVVFGSFNFSRKAQLEYNHLEVDNDPAVCQSFWAEWQKSRTAGLARPQWQLRPSA